MSENPPGKTDLVDRSRLNSLTATGLLDTPERESLNRFARIASTAIDAPISLVSLVDDNRQFFAAAHGLGSPWKERRETPLSHSFCQYVVLDRSKLVVNDSRNDQRVCDNLAVDELHVAAYAGVPLSDPAGNVLGSLCVIDEKPRNWTPAELELLELIAGAVVREIELARGIQRAEKAESDLAEINQEISALHERAAEDSAAVMHDLRTPLQVVSVAVASLSAHPLIQDSAQLTRTVDMLDRNVRQAFNLVKTSAQQRAGNDLYQLVDVHELVERVCTDLATAKPVELELSLEPGTVHADPVMVRRAVQNLFSNALRFAAGIIRVTVRSRDDLVQVVVEDDGEGLPREQDYQHVWELGRRFHASRSNTGLGLAVTRQLVVALGGSVRARPSELGGARFELWLPGARPDSEQTKNR